MASSLLQRLRGFQSRGLRKLKCNGTVNTQRSTWLLAKSGLWKRPVTHPSDTCFAGALLAGAVLPTDAVQIGDFLIRSGNSEEARASVAAELNEIDLNEETKPTSVTGSMLQESWDRRANKALHWTAIPHALHARQGAFALSTPPPADHSRTVTPKLTACGSFGD
jgi:hypothetical protein